METEQYIREKARFYGKDSSKPITVFQRKVNEAAEELALACPSLLHTRQTLLERARKKVDDDGYVYKKGKSRSKQHPENESDSSTSTPAPKRVKVAEAVRVQRIAHIQDTIAEINREIGFKDLRIEQAKNSNQFALCEKVTEEIRNLKQKRFELETELKGLHRKQQQCLWYKRKAKKCLTKQQPTSATPCTSEYETSTTVYPYSSESSRSRSSTPGATTPQQKSSSHTPVFSPPSIPQSRLPNSSPLSSVSPPSSVQTGDTVLLSSDIDNDSHFC